MPSIPGTTSYPAAIDDQDSLLRAIAWPVYTTLRWEIGAAETTIPVESTLGMPATGIARIVGERIIYTALTSTTLTGCTRGAHQGDGGAPASAHPGGADVGVLHLSTHHRVHSDAIVALEGEVNTLKAGGGGGGSGTILIDFFLGDNGLNVDREWTNMPAAATPLFGKTTNVGTRFFDLTNATQFRVQASLAIAGTASSVLRAEYSTDLVTWLTLGATADVGQVSLSTASVNLGTFGNIVAGAKAGVYLRLVGQGGNGVADPMFGAIALEIKGGGAGGGGGSGEANTASNAGTGGVGVTLAKAGVDLPFKSINAGSAKVSVTDDTTNKNVDIDVAEASLTLSNIGGAVTDAQVPNTITLDNLTQITARSHTSLADIGTNTHPQIDTHLAAPHAPAAATYITQTADAGLSAEQALSALATGLLKVTTTTGVLSTAVAADLPAHDHDAAYVNVAGDTMTGALNIRPLGDARIVHGRVDGVASYPAIDFHSGAVATNYDAQILAGGGNGADRGGWILVQAAGFDFNGVPVVTTTDAQTLTNKSLTAPKLASAALLGTPVAATLEYDGTGLYFTNDLTNGRTDDNMQNVFRLAADGAAIGPTIASYFGANSALPTVAGALYELTYYLWYLKTTAGTVVYRLTNTQPYTNIVAAYVQTAAGGIATSAATTAAGIVTTTLAAAALPATAALTTAVNHHAIIRAIAEINLAGNIRLNVTSSAGTITPLQGSYYTARRLPSGNVGTFSA